MTSAIESAQSDHLPSNGRPLVMDPTRTSAMESLQSDHLTKRGLRKSHQERPRLLVKVQLLEVQLVLAREVQRQAVVMVVARQDPS